MSWYKTVHIQCDGGEYDCMTDPDVHYTDDKVEEARADLAKHGWVHRDGIDLCPICVIRRDTGCVCEINCYWDQDKYLIPYDRPQDVTPGCPAHDKKAA